MSRFNTGGGYDHYCNYYKHYNYYRIGWYFDRYYSGSRLRFPQKIERDTDEAGARKFCKKWEIEFPNKDEN